MFIIIDVFCYRNDVQKQSEFVRSLLTQPEWAQISCDSESTQNFVSILQESVFQDKRILFMKNFTLLGCIIRRVKKLGKVNGVLQQIRSAESNTLSSCGPVEPEIPHPAYDAACPFLPVVLKLVKTVHSLLDDPQLSFLLDLTEQEKSHIIGIHFSGGTQTAVGEVLPASVSGTDSEKSHPEKLKVSRFF